MLGDWIMIVAVWQQLIQVQGFMDRAACMAAAEKVIMIWPERGIPVKSITCKRLQDV
jgi:hypothetical protein